MESLVRASPQAQIVRPLSEWSVDQQVPGQFALQLRHDKPLLVEGHVLDGEGRPLAGAQVAVIARFPRPTFLRSHHPQPLGTGTAREKGTFHMRMPSLPLHQVERLYVVARADGYGVAAAELDITRLRHQVNMQLERERPLHGRMVGPDGRPAAGVEVRTRTFYERWPDEPLPRTSFACSTDLQPPAWIPPATTDDQGRFVLRGIAPSKAQALVFQFSIDDPRYAPLDPDLPISFEGEQGQAFAFRPDGSDEPTIRLEEPRFIEGTIVCKDTKEPMAEAWLSVVFANFTLPADTQGYGTWVKTDAQGRFHARGRPRACCTIYVYPPIGLPYPAWGESTKWPAGAIKQQITIEVPRGILLRGKIVDEGSGKPAAGAAVEYQLRIRQDSPYYDKSFAHRIYWAAEYREILADEEGVFHMAVVPGVGHLMVKAPGPEFISRYVTWDDLQYDRPGSYWYVLEGLARIDPKPETDKLELTIPLRRGLTVRGRVLSPHGEPVAKAAILTPAYPRLVSHHSVPTTAWPRPVIDGRFELQGCDADKPRRVYFLDAERQWGASVDLDPAQARREPLTIRLLPCGSASARFVDHEDKPWVNARVPVSIYLIFEKGRPRPATSTWDHLDWWWRPADRRRYESLRTDSEGRVTFPTLIPEAPYMLRLWDEVMTAENQKEKELEFTVAPGQTQDLGQIALKRPQ